MDQLFSFLSSAGYPTTMVGGVLLMFFYFRKAEAGIRAENAITFERLQKQVAELKAEIEQLEDELRQRETQIDELRKLRREAEDREIEAIRRANEAEAQLRALGKIKNE